MPVDLELSFHVDRKTNEEHRGTSHRLIKGG